ncbi:MAG: hypothetical protein FWC26_09330 [Fibromonadales bacterium]|nr:hypothetical protein [Fibromonadales bacterium]
MKTIALTGATSMIGIALIKQCILNGIKVTAFIRSNTSRLNRLPNSDLIKIVSCNLEVLKPKIRNRHKSSFSVGKYNLYWLAIITIHNAKGFICEQSSIMRVAKQRYF